MSTNMSYFIFLLIFFNIEIVAGAQPRIAAGKAIEMKQYPYLGQVRGVWTCGGTLIGKKWVLMAAHCVEERSDPQISVLFNEKQFQEEYAQHAYSDLVIYHEEYAFIGKGDAKNYESFPVNDIAIARLYDPVPQNENVSIVKLNEEHIEPGAECTVIGWGAYNMSSILKDGKYIRKPTFYNQSKVLRDAQVDVINYTQCASPKKVHLKRSKKLLFTNSLIPATQYQIGPLPGDSGGPLICDGAQAGIVSDGIMEEVVENGKIVYKYFCTSYTRIEQFIPWIKENIKEQDLESYYEIFGKAEKMRSLDNGDNGGNIVEVKSILCVLISIIYMLI